jgi:hypothetical protein
LLLSFNGVAFQQQGNRFKKEHNRSVVVVEIREATMQCNAILYASYGIIFFQQKRLASPNFTGRDRPG